MRYNTQQMVIPMVCWLSVVRWPFRQLLVTNAEHGWVEMSCKRYMPELLGVLAQACD